MEWRRFVTYLWNDPRVSYRCGCNTSGCEMDYTRHWPSTLMNIQPEPSTAGSDI